MLDKALAWIDRHLLWLLSAVLVLRAGFLFGNGLDRLATKVTWDWPRQPDWCYYSKLPMVAG